MARELRYWQRMVVKQSNQPDFEPPPVYQTIDLTGTNHSKGITMNIPVTATVVPQQADLGNVGFVYVENPDTSNYFLMGGGSWSATNAPIRIPANTKGWLIPWNSAQVSASANSATITGAYFRLLER